MVMISEKNSQVPHPGLKLGILLPQPSECWERGMYHHMRVLLLVLVCETVQLLNATAVKIYYLKVSLYPASYCLIPMSLSFSLCPCPLKYPEFKISFWLISCSIILPIWTDYVHFKELNVCICIPQYTYGCQRTTWNYFFPYMIWVLGIKLRCQA